MRLATPADLPLVTSMIREFLLEQWKAGAPVCVSHKNLEVYRDLARCYLTGSLFGVVVLDEDGQAFVLAGEESGPPRFETTLGKTATLWAAWTSPELRQHGRAKEMVLFACERLSELGIDTLVMASREQNPASQAGAKAIGATLEERVYYRSLKGPPEKTHAN